MKTRPTLADLLKLVTQIDLPPIRKRDMLSAIRTIARALGGTPEEVPLDIKQIRRRLEAIIPEGLGFTRDRWNNARSLFSKAVELTTPLMPSVQKTPISPEWWEIIDPLPLRDGQALGPLARFLSARGVGPLNVTLPDLEAYRIAITESRLRARPEKTWNILAWCWNRLVKSVKGWPQIIIPREDKRIRYVLDWSAFPESFKADVDAYIRLLAGLTFDEDGPLRPLRPISLKNCEHLLRAAASALVASGHAADRIRSIADVARLESIKVILEHVFHRGGTEHRAGAHKMAQTLRACAKYWVKVDDAELAKIGRFVARLTPPKGLTPKNRERLMKFNDPEIVQRFLALPQRMAEEIKQREGKTILDAVEVQIAVAIAILQAVPIRIRNLVSLDLEQHFVSIGNRVYVVLPAEEVKNAQPLQLELPDEVAGLLTWYCMDYRPLLATTPTTALFITRSGKQKTREHFGTQITKRVRKYLGVPVNPHLFRHLAAKLYLDHHPGEYGLIARLLGHKTVTTTMAFYAGAETASAARRFQSLVQDLRDNTPRKRGKPKGKPDPQQGPKK